MTTDSTKPLLMSAIKVLMCSLNSIFYKTNLCFKSVYILNGANDVANDIFFFFVQARTGTAGTQLSLRTQLNSTQVNILKDNVIVTVGLLTQFNGLLCERTCERS